MLKLNNVNELVQLVNNYVNSGNVVSSKFYFENGTGLNYTIENEGTPTNPLYTVHVVDGCIHLPYTTLYGETVGEIVNSITNCINNYPNNSMWGMEEE